MEFGIGLSQKRICAHFSRRKLGAIWTVCRMKKKRIYVMYKYHFLGGGPLASYVTYISTRVLQLMIIPTQNYKSHLLIHEMHLK